MFLTIFGLRPSIVLTFSVFLSSFVSLYASRVLHTIESHYLELLVHVRKIYNNDDKTFFFRILTVVKHPCVLNINEATTL